MEPLILGPSGRPTFTEHEVEVNACSEVSVTGPNDFAGTYLVRLTNFRLIFQDTRSNLRTTSSDQNKAQTTPHRMLHWSWVASYARGSSFLWWPSLTISLHLYSGNQQTTQSVPITLTFSKEQIDKFFKDLQLQQDRKSWLHYPMEYLVMTGKMEAEQVTVQTPKATPSRPSTAMTGISGLTKHIEEKHRAVDTSLKEAFQDMDSLFEKAKEMVAIANRLSSATKNSSDTEEQSHFQSDMMLMMGIRSPVTLGSHDNFDMYCEELARELDVFVCSNFEHMKTKKLQRQQSNALTQEAPLQMTTRKNPSGVLIASEVLPLTDLYCMFNRARGTALVSPEDLVQACKRLAPLGLRCRLIQLNDGVKAVASDGYDERKIASQVAQLLQEVGPMSAAQLSGLQGIGLPLSLHYLLRAESEGLASRDHSSEGLIFWPNIFSTYAKPV